MSVLPDHEIARRAEAGMITPFVGMKCTDRGPSYGLSSAGYDCRLADTIWIARPGTQVVDLANLPDAKDLFEVAQIRDSFVVRPGTFCLMHTVEWFRMPCDLLGRCTGKSTLRRLGKINDMTPLEPGWEGHLVVEINFSLPRPVKIYAGMGICQVVFDRLERPCEQNYAQLGGKYQGQRGVTAAR